MKNIGISLYPGLGIKKEKYVAYIQKAAQNNVTKAFISLQLPESNQEKDKDALFLINEAKKVGIDVIVDISREYYDKYDWEAMKIYGLRLDAGFSDEEIVKLTHQNQMMIFLNASTVDANNFVNLEKLGINKNQLGVVHNYYPKPNSGLSRNYFKKRNQFYHEKGLVVFAFAANLQFPRMPLFLGLPTVEEHRKMSLITQIQELWTLESDIACVGDLYIDDQQFNEIKNLDPEILTIIVQLYQNQLDEKTQEILSIVHKNRPDQSAYLIRSESSRTTHRFKYSEFNNHKSIQAFDLLIDNLLYPRYSGELEIILRDAEPNKWINVIGNCSESKWLLENKEIEKFNFKVVKNG